MKMIGTVFATRRAAALALLAGMLLFLPQAVEVTHAAEKAAIHTDNAWARASIGKTGRSAAYFTIANRGSAADRLIAVKGDVAGDIEMHENVMEGDVMRMRALPDGVEVPAGEKVAFEPAGKHVMLIGLKKPLKEGDSFPLTLVFEKAGEVAVDVAVRKGAPGGGHMHHKH